MRTRVRWTRAAAAAGAAWLVMLLGPRAFAGNEVPQAPPEQVHIVGPGETLWGIALSFTEQGGDPRPVVQWLIDRNDVTGALHPGDRLLVPSG